jgi:hypothetical protein
MHRLLKYSGAKRILYIFESSHAIDYTAHTLEQLTLPDSEATFSDLYTIQYLQGGLLDQHAAICITTPDQLYDTFLREASQQRTKTDNIIQIRYNSQIPIEYFDIIFIGNCDYFAYQRWQPFIEYFDAFIIGIGDDISEDLYRLFDNNIAYRTSQDDEDVSEEIETSSQRQKQIAATMRAVRNLLRTDEGLFYESDRLSQLVWLLLLKNLDDFEQAQQEVMGKDYKPIIEKGFRWRDWVVGMTPIQWLTGEDLLTFINRDVIPYLSRLNGEGPRDIRTTIGTIFRDTTNHIRSGSILREVISKLNTINFNSSTDLQLSHAFMKPCSKRCKVSPETTESSIHHMRSCASSLIVCNPNLAKPCSIRLAAQLASW